MVKICTWRSLTRKHSLQTLLRRLSSSTSTIKEATVYVHWPFCKKLCPYCDFNKYIRRKEDVSMMVDFMVKEMSYYIRTYRIDRIKSVYFGGGTPSLAPRSLVSDILKAIQKLSSLSSSAEITMEVNPTSFETEKLTSFKKEGINRVSIGVQALNNTDLKVLGREHDVKSAISCYKDSMELFEGRVSIDLMFGRANQSTHDWENELNQVMSLDCNHISLYQLTMKKHTSMERLHRRGELILPSEDALSEMYQFSVQHLRNYDLQRYEVSNFAKPGHQGKHNFSYWKGDDYVGVGPGAHGRLTTPMSENKEEIVRHALLQLPLPGKWMEAVRTHGHGTKLSRALSQNERITELILLGMRTTEGINEKIFLPIVGFDIKTLSTLPRVITMIEEGYISLNEHNIKVSDFGMNILDSVCGELVVAIEEYLSVT